MTGFVMMLSSIAIRDESWSLTQPGPLAGAPLTDAAIVRVFGGMIGKRRRRRPPTSDSRPFLKPGWFGLLLLNTYLLAAIPVWVLNPLGHPTPVGLRVHLLRPEVVLERNPGIQPVLVRVVAASWNVRPSLYVDSKLVSWEEFGAVLQKELNRRPPNWPVYLEGSPDMDWGHAVKAIDTIRGLHVEVVLLTRR